VSKWRIGGGKKRGLSATEKRSLLTTERKKGGNPPYISGYGEGKKEAKAISFREGQPLLRGRKKVVLKKGDGCSIETRGEKSIFSLEEGRKGSTTTEKRRPLL